MSTNIAISRIAAGSDHHPSVGMVIAGGWDMASNFFDVVERSTDSGATWSDLPQLPKKISYPCLVIIDDKTLALTGGENSKLY